MDEGKGKVRETIEALLIAVIFLRFANTFVAQTFYIPSGSMEETLQVGDHLFVNRFIFGQEGFLGDNPLVPARPVKRGDVVVFRSVEDPTVDVVKRCVGLPGDEVRIEDKQLYLNGERVDDSAYAIHKLAGEQGGQSQLQIRAYVRRRDNFGPVEVPGGHYFCMGDNRDNSHDSRFWGFLPAHLIKGRAFFVYWSYGGGTPDGKWRGWGPKLAQLGRTAAGFFTKTRWDRTFLLVR